MPLARLALLILCLPACKVYDPLFCDKDHPCTDPTLSFCDLEGEYAASDGVARTCIPTPVDAGVADAGNQGVDDSGGARTDGAAPCAWSRFAKLANINSAEGESPGSFDSEALTLYFQRVRLGDEETDGIYYASRSDITAPFGRENRIAELGAHKQDPEISTSGLEILMSSPTGDGIEFATRTSPTGTFTTPEPTGLLGFSPSLSGDGLALYFVNGSSIVQRSVRSSIGAPWGPPEDVLPTEGYLYVDVSPDELQLLLTRNPIEFPSKPLEIAARGSTDESFGAPAPLDDEILVDGDALYAGAAWDGHTQMVVGVLLTSGTDDNVHIYYSVCQ